MIASCDTEDEAKEYVGDLVRDLVTSTGLSDEGWESTTYAKFADNGQLSDVLVVHDFQPNVAFNDPQLIDMLTTEDPGAEIILGDPLDVTTHRIVTVDLTSPVEDGDAAEDDPDIDDPIET